MGTAINRRENVRRDELNKYAPREGDSPIKQILLDVAERGRSLGVILIGAQQTASEVERRSLAPVRVQCQTPRQMQLANALCGAWEQSTP